MMMRPEVWREHIFPTESITVEAPLPRDYSRVCTQLAKVRPPKT